MGLSAWLAAVRVHCRLLAPHEPTPDLVRISQSRVHGLVPARTQWTLFLWLLLLLFLILCIFGQTRGRGGIFKCFPMVLKLYIYLFNAWICIKSFWPEKKFKKRETVKTSRNINKLGRNLYFLKDAERS